MRLKNIILLTAATWRFRHSGVDRKKTLQEHFRARIFAIFFAFCFAYIPLKVNIARFDRVFSLFPTFAGEVKRQMYRN